MKVQMFLKSADVLKVDNCVVKLPPSLTYIFMIFLDSYVDL